MMLGLYRVSHGLFAPIYLGHRASQRLLGRASYRRQFSLILVLVFIIKVNANPSTSPNTNNAGTRADDTPDFFEDYWSDDSSTFLSEQVRRLLKEHPENKEFLQSLEPQQFYQITYPVQLQKHGKNPGISTRDANKNARAIPIDSAGPGPDGAPRTLPIGQHNSGYRGMPRGVNYRTNTHVHRTSYRIKAFSHVFTVDLELNDVLLSPKIVASHRTSDGKTHMDDQIEHCYYHGTVKDYSGAVAAFRTCNGIAGVIQLGNETLIVSPMAGGETLPKHPHFVIEAKKAHIKQKCGIYPGYERTTNWEQSYKHGRKRKQARHRYARDIRGTTKIIETALFLDKKFMDDREQSKVRAMHDALLIANIADLYFKNIKTRLSITYLETWNGKNRINLEKKPSIHRTLQSFNEYTARSTQNINKDTSHLLTGEKFQGDESGMSNPDSICTNQAAGISVDLNIYEPHLVASTMAHEIGHNLHMKHDEGRSKCYCQDWHGCIMAKSVVGQENVQPSKFSKCSVDDFNHALANKEETKCLVKSSQSQLPPLNPILTHGVGGGGGVKSHDRTFNCGNGRVDPGEQCDCGPSHKCNEIDPCCDPTSCMLKIESECASGPCCDNCLLRRKGTPCRQAQTECDITERCDGVYGTCPKDIYKKNGSKCGNGKGYCYNGVCPTLDDQCRIMWGHGGIAADETCFKDFNKEGNINGNCGKLRNGNLAKCELGDIMCGTLQCQKGMQHPVTPNLDQSYSRTVNSVNGHTYECKTVRYDNNDISASRRDWSLVADGTACGEKLICVNQTCVSLYPYIDQGECKTNNNALECSGKGVCSNVNTCSCEDGWVGDDCSIFDRESVYTTPRTTLDPVPTNIKGTTDASTDTKATGSSKNVTYVEQQGSDTVFLVVVLVSGVGGVFFVFAFMALCYRRKSTMPKYDVPYVKRPIVKKPPQQHLQPMHKPTDETSLEMGGRILTFSNMPTYRGGMDASYSSGIGTLDSCREHKLQGMKRPSGPASGSQSEEEALQSGVEGIMGEWVSSMDGIGSPQVALRAGLVPPLGVGGSRSGSRQPLGWNSPTEVTHMSSHSLRRMT